MYKDTRGEVRWGEVSESACRHINSLRIRGYNWIRDPRLSASRLSVSKLYVNTLLSVFLLAPPVFFISAYSFLTKLFFCCLPSSWDIIYKLNSSKAQSWLRSADLSLSLSLSLSLVLLFFSWRDHHSAGNFHRVSINVDCQAKIHTEKRESSLGVSFFEKIRC